MKLILITNFYNHHQSVCGEALYNLLGDDFKMVFRERVPSDRAALGWAESVGPKAWIMEAYSSEQARQQLHRYIEEYDAVIYGDCPIALVRSRISQGKLTYKYSERWFKRGILLGFPWWFRRLTCDYWPLDLPNHHLLAAGAYCFKDMRRVGLYKNRMWKWGYFTEVPAAPPVARASDCVRILWAGRMLGWKRVDVLIRAANYLKTRGHRFILNLIGDGVEKNTLVRLCKHLGLEDSVCFLGPTTPERVRIAMREAHIYVLPSGEGEGWGAVINEAMSEGCCVVASSGAGATPWLIRDGVTGFCFPSGDSGTLGTILEGLVQEPNRCRLIGLDAWESMRTTWSPQIAAERLVALVGGMLGERPLADFSDGPCSSCLD